jgi:hypothetical protein
MNASIVILVLWGSLNPQITQSSIKWDRDYVHARELSSQLQKPLAVFVGNGSNGWKQVVRGGVFDAETRRMLAERFVPVYIDAGTNAGQKLAEAFELAGKHGLIVSDRTGELMAFRQDGDLEPKDLAKHLNRLADPEHVVITTESNEAPAPVHVAPAGGYTNPFACQT